MTINNDVIKHISQIQNKRNFLEVIYAHFTGLGKHDDVIFLSEQFPD